MQHHLDAPVDGFDRVVPGLQQRREVIELIVLAERPQHATGDLIADLHPLG
ncbi:hypothetical protein OKW39_007931 [Paraburkholderia sp. MM6662-R1]